MNGEGYSKNMLQIFKKCDGIYSVVLPNFDGFTQLRTLDVRTLDESALLVLLNEKVDKSQRKENNVPTASQTTNAAATGIVQALCSVLGHDVIVNDQTHSNKGQFIPHILNGIVKIGSECRVASFLPQGMKENISLQYFSLFPHQSPATHSPIFNLIVYQLVRIFEQLSKRSIYVLPRLCDVVVDNNYWLSVSLGDILQAPCLIPISENQKSKNKHSRQSCEFDTDLASLTSAWTQNRLSNFDYLIKLNEFAGRERNNMYRHPIFPWVTDFTNPTAANRPLDRTKYRLKKGDDQLHMQYTKQSPAYHVPEVLSDICFMMYRARVESKENLSKHVRPQWVPEEYPSSMERLYQWTPDECIPEFFEDITILKSIHDDMDDLQLPSFVNSPEEFITWHRSILESEAVSANLHHWIDLNFGYLLNGKPAVNALNVHLSFIDPNKSSRFVGPVQLFFEPHPMKEIPNPSKTKDTYLDDQKTLDADFSGCELNDRLSEIVRSSEEPDSNYHYCRKSATNIAVLIIELAFPQECRNLGSAASFDQRLKRASEVFGSRKEELPPHLCRPVERLLSKAHIFQKEIIDGNFFNIPPSIIYAYEKFAEFHRQTWIIQRAPVKENYQARDAALKSALKITGLSSICLQMFTFLLTDKYAANSCYSLVPDLAKNISRQEFMTVASKIERIFDVNTFNVIKLFDSRFLLQLSVAYGAEQFLDRVVPKFVEMLLLANDQQYHAFKDIILWTARRYGSIQAATKITSKLLCLLPFCYATDDKREQITSSDNLTFEVRGDIQCHNILNCLLEIIIMFGTTFVTVQCLPFCADVFDQAKGRSSIPASLENAMISSVVLLNAIANCLTDSQLLDQLEDVVVAKILFVAVRLFSSASLTFATTEGRRLLAYKTMYTLHSIADRIGSDNVERHMALSIQRLFSTFSVIYDIDAKGNLQVLQCPPKQLDQIFSPNFAILLLHIFSFTCGRQFTFSLIQNSKLILKLEQEADMNVILPISTASRTEELATSPQSSGVVLSSSLPTGNRLNFSMGFESNDSTPPSMEMSFDRNTLWSQVSLDSPTHLHGTWADHFRAALTSTSSLIPFDQIQLCTFSGHGGPIKKVVLLDHENSFISASLDKTVKLWSLKSTYDVITSQMSYDKHNKGVHDVVMLQHEGKIASTDGTVLLWDPFCDKTIQELSWKNSGSDVFVNALSTYGQRSIVLSSVSATMLMFYDTRTLSWANRLLTVPPSEACLGIKSFSISPDENYVACALLNGFISVIDLRVFKLLGFLSATDAEIVQIEWLSSNLFAVLSSDQSSKVFELSPQLRTVARLTEPAVMISALSSHEYAAVQTSNRVRFYADNEFRHEVKLRSDFISGSVTQLVYMKLNKAFIIGSTTGMMRLAC